MIPTTYADWRRCIEQDCGLRLTPAFIAARLADLRDPSNHHTQQFIHHYGAGHHAWVVGWFEQAGRGTA